MGGSTTPPRPEHGLHGAERLARELRGHRVGACWMAKCPAHDDQVPSLSIKESEGRLLVHCHAGCQQDLVIDALKARGLWPETGRHIQQQIIYEYTDEQGLPLFEVVRFYPKDFRFRRLGPGKEYIWNLDGARRVLYHLPEVIAAPELFLVEGEKDVETLRKWGLTATTVPGGAGKWRSEYAGYFSHKAVTILPDCDEPGRKHALTIAQSLLGISARVRILELPHGKDVTEWA